MAAVEHILPNATTILLVDDEVLITDMVCDALMDSGFDVVIANDGGEALDVIGMNLGIHALVTDLNMGPGADGWHVARCAREYVPSCRWSTRPVARRTSGSDTASTAAFSWSSRSTSIGSLRR